MNLASTFTNVNVAFGRWLLFDTIYVVVVVKKGRASELNVLSALLVESKRSDTFSLNKSRMKHSISFCLSPTLTLFTSLPYEFMIRKFMFQNEKLYDCLWLQQQQQQ